MGGKNKKAAQGRFGRIKYDVKLSACAIFRLKRISACGHVRDVQPKRDGHWHLPYAHGNRVCFFSF